MLSLLNLHQFRCISKFNNLINKIQLMHNYTVGNRFTTKTKLGNWYEEAELNDYNFKEYLSNRQNGLNNTLNTKTKLGFSNQPKQLAPIDESLRVYYGDCVALGSQFIEGVLAFNINQSILNQQSYAVSTTKDIQPSLRNVFTISYVGEDNQDGVLRYGDKIRIHAQCGEKKLYLQSLATTPMRSSKFSRHQQVSVTTSCSSSSLWVIDHFNPTQRFDCKGKQVQVGEKILIKHCLTSQWLASDKVTYVNNFGKQFQVFGKSFTTNNKTQNLHSQKLGHGDVQTPLRNQDSRNAWRILKGRK